MGVAQMEIELGTLLGRKVDLRTAEDLSIYFRDQVRSQAVVQFARG
jgi:predicted nucleotidyltransferase